MSAFNNEIRMRTEAESIRLLIKTKDESPFVHSKQKLNGQTQHGIPFF
ncbi:hypothetical protein [Treponema phagedenis]|nr:hypothetical protein [Treponema phagedenis]